jgi:membrane-bound metal-dependent hydrolase YbcI (DUF457 family)
MDIATHALASLVLSRAVLPRAPRILWFWTICGGVIADSDQLSALVSPSAYLTWYHTYTHSLLASFIIAGVFAALYRACTSPELRTRLPVVTIFVGVLLVAWLHLAMDIAQWQGVELFWPFRTARMATDWLPTIDPWIVTILIAALAFPEFLHLVTSEIGAKDKRPRGFVGAIVGLAFLLLYLGLRAELHATAVAQLQNRSYAGEPPRKIAAYSEFTSLVSWRGLAETESALHEVKVYVGSARPVMIDPGISLFKPEPSLFLQAAESTEAATRFLRVARFPRATIQKLDTGAEVQIRDLRYRAAGEAEREPMVMVECDASGKVLSEEVAWSSDKTPR